METNANSPKTARTRPADAAPPAPRHTLSDRGQAAVDAYRNVHRLRAELEQADRDLTSAVIGMPTEDALLYYEVTERIKNPSASPAAHAAPETPGV